MFVDRLSEMSCIVEVLDQDDSIPDGVAVATYYFNDLASCNEASNVVVLANEVLPGNQYTPKLPESCPRYSLLLTHSITLIHSLTLTHLLLLGVE